MKWWLMLLAALWLPSGAATEFESPAANRYAGGQPSAAALLELRDAGVRHVINLRTDAEPQAYDEAAQVTALGMTYHHLPVAGAAGVNVENAQALDALLAGLGDEPLLLHCASGNRVGALMALRAALHGSSTEAAIAEGYRWGLRSLTPVVRQRLQASCLNIDSTSC